MSYETEENTPSVKLQNNLNIQDSIYMERSGKGSRALTEKLLDLPEDPLSVEDAELAVAYEGEICDHPVSESLTLEGLIKTRKSETHKYYAEAFMDGHIQVPGLEGQLLQHRTPEDLYRWLAEAARDGSVSVKDFRELSRQSIAYYKTEMEQALLTDKEPAKSLFESMTIAIEPEKVIEFAHAGKEARQFMMSQRKSISSTARGLNGAKRALVDIYTKKVNGLVVNDVTSLQNLINQSQLINDEDTVSRAVEALPPNFADAVSNSRSRSLLYKRFDYIRNGIGYDADGKASAVDNGIFNSVETEDGKEQASPVYTAEDKERLRAVKMNKEAIHALFKDVIADANMLSSEDESTWNSTRGRRAADGLFQVVYQPVKDTLAVNSIDGTLKTPNVDRSIYEVLTVGAHELTHINQAQADQALGVELRIGELKGRRVSMLREAGANLVQRQFEKELFGESKPMAYAYAKAIQCFEAGGSVWDANKAFYEEKLTSGGASGKAAIAKETADRVLRLGGGKHSRPLSYVEENLMNNELVDAPVEVRTRATQITTLDLDDQVRLHTYGLLPEVTDASTNWSVILLKRMQPYIDDALKK